MSPTFTYRTIEFLPTAPANVHRSIGALALWMGFGEVNSAAIADTLNAESANGWDLVSTHTELIGYGIMKRVVAVLRRPVIATSEEQLP